MGMFAVRCAKGIGRAVCALGLGSLTMAADQAPSRSVPEHDIDDTITVTGSRLEPEEIRRRAVEFVRQTGVATGERSVARWIDPVCPRAIGVGPSYAIIVESKLRDIANAARVPVASEPCQTNIAVSFTDDGGALARKIAVRAPRRFAEVPITERKALIDGSAPVRWWYATETRSKDGSPAASIAAPWTAGNAEGGGSVLPMNSDTTSLHQYSSSIVSTQAVRALTSATVVIDVNRAEGLPLDAVATFAALVAFAEIRVGDSPPPDSILGLFEERGSLRTLSERDLAFLRALYRLPLDRQARQQRGRLVRELIAAEMGQ